FISFVLALLLIYSLSIASVEAKETTSDPLAGSIYKETPPDLYPEEKTVPEAGEDFPAYNQVVTNPSTKNLSGLGWKQSSSKPVGYDKGYWVAGSDRAKSVQYKTKIPATDVYTVFAWWPQNAGKQAKARFGISTTSGTKWSEVDQSEDGGYWVPIGEHEMKKGKRFSVTIERGSGGKGRPIADTIALVRGVYDYPPDPPGLAPVDTTQDSSKSEGAAASPALQGESTYTGAAVRRISPRTILRRSKGHIGTPYRLGGLSVCKPYRWEDCSCFTRLVFKRWRVLPDNPAAQRKARRMAVVRKRNLKTGDLVFHDTTGDGRMTAYDHVSIYAGNGYVIHANSYYKYKKVHRQKMKYLRNYAGARRVRH
ncbi:MAG: NlpC/P60 family protein, partial [Rubrobacteraceae bacterium]